MFPDEVILSVKEKTTLARVKGRTGLQSWRVLCRWAISLSLGEQTVPHPAPTDDLPSNVRLDWGEILGLEAPLYRAAQLFRLSQQGIPVSDAEVYVHLRLHLARGITYLGASSRIRSLRDLVELALPGEDSRSAAVE